MSVFIRRFLSDPGADVLLQIESVNILDLEPPAAIQGIGTGTVLIVGEFEDGPFLAPREVTSPDDFAGTYGQLGYTYGAIVGNNPCARGRKADGALVAEAWNGNGFVQLNAKKFARLLISRVDTSAGSVQFSRQACVTGAASFRYALASGQILALDVGAAPASATFTGGAASVTGVAGTFPTTFAGGETLTLGFDDAVANPNFVTTFLAADQSNAQVVARINQYAGFAFADLNAGQIRFTGRQLGLGGQVRVVSGSSGVLALLGLTAATTAGSGNVANIAAVTPAEVATVVQAAVANTKVELDSQGRLRVSNTGSTGWIRVAEATTASALGFVAGQEGTSDGRAVLVSGAGTFPTGFAGGETLSYTIDGTAYTTTFGANQALAAVVAAFNATIGSTKAFVDGAARFTIQGALSGGSVAITGASGAGVLATLGLTLSTSTGIAPALGQLPAGTVVQVSGGQQFVTMQALVFGAGGVSIAGSSATKPTQLAAAGPWNVKVRHALDDGTGTQATAGSIAVIASPPDVGSFAVVNPQLVTAALTETAIDVAYSAAFDATLDLNSVAKEANVVFSARQSNVVRRKGRQNAIDASSSGLFGRMWLTRPPLGTLKGVALSTNAEPGVGAYRDQRTVYCYPGGNTFVPLVGRRGLAGGAGFTSDGNVDVGADGFMASILSQLNPEENPGQETAFAGGVNALESSPNAQGYTIADYILFKAAGIAALRVDDGVAIFQSGVTSVDPGASPNLATIKRRRMADYIEDTLARAAKRYGKKLNTIARRQSIQTEIFNFLNTLLSPKDPSSQRIDGFTIDAVSGNTPELQGRGLYKIIIRVRLLASLDAIVLAATIGETVTIEKIAA